MATINYPPSLPDFRLGKQRQEVQTYRTSQPFNGPLFIEKITDESPVVWDVTITCSSQGQARGFQAFLRQVKNGTPFNKDILIEEGFSTHEVRFIEEPLSPRQLSPHVWVYTGVIYAVKLVSNDALVDDNLIILYAGQSDIIDTAVNIFWPAKPADIVNPFARLANPLVHLFTNDKTVEKLTNGTLTTDRATTGTQVGRTTGIIETVAIDTIREEAEGFLIEGASTNEALHNRDFTNAVHVKTNITPLKDAIGADGVVNSASTLTATAANGTVFQTVTKASAENTYSIDIRRKTGTGIIEISDDAGSTFTDVTSSINNSTYTRFQITTTQANPSVGVRIVTSGDEIEVDYEGLEVLPFASSRIPTTTTAVTRAADDISFPALNNIQSTVDDFSFLIGNVDMEAENAIRTILFIPTLSQKITIFNANNVIKVFNGVDVIAGTTTTDLVNSVAITVGSGVTNLYINGLFEGSVASVPFEVDTSLSVIVGREGVSTTFVNMNDVMSYNFEATATEIALLQG
jgi:hypothetical protein